MNFGNKRLSGNVVIHGPAVFLDSIAHEMNTSEATKMIDAAAQRYLGISGPEFIRAWHAGQFPTPVSAPDVTRVAGLLALLD